MNAQTITYFDNHPEVDVFYFTSDGFAFFTMAEAGNHAGHLEDKEIATIVRTDNETE